MKKRNDSLLQPPDPPSPGCSGATGGSVAKQWSGQGPTEPRNTGNLKAMSSRLEKMRGMFKMRRAPEKSEKDAKVEDGKGTVLHKQKVPVSYLRMVVAALA